MVGHTSWLEGASLALVGHPSSDGVTIKILYRLDDFDSSNMSDPDCIPVVFLKNCEPKVSYILAELFNKCLKESCFPDCWKISSLVPVFKNVWGKVYS